jgi:hypothetical protein
LLDPLALFFFPPPPDPAGIHRSGVAEPVGDGSGDGFFYLLLRDQVFSR